MTDPSALNMELRSSLLLLDFNVGFARAVVQDMVDGLVWVSPTVGAGAAHVVHPYGMSLVWGDLVDVAFEEIIARLVSAPYRDRDESLQIDPRWAHLPWRERLQHISSPREHLAEQPRDRPFIDTRVNFTFNSDTFRSRFTELQPPPGWSIQRAAVEDFSRPGAVVPNRFWRNADDFLAHGGGWRIERGEDVGALAFTSFQFDEQYELGIETSPSHRHEGLATAVAAHMIADLLEHRHWPVWACRAGNTGSVRLAQRLGFSPARQLDYFQLAPRSSELR